MVIKPILDVDIDPDDKLGQYVKKYQDYEERLKKTPGMWSQAAGEAQHAADAFTKSSAALLAMLDMADKLGEKTRATRKQADDTASAWAKSAKNTAAFAVNVGRSVLSLAKWVGLLEGAAGLVGFGSFLGLEKLARDVGGTRRSSLGLGTTYGEQLAFQTDLGRLVDTRGFLGGVSESLGDVTKRRFLYSAGLTPGQIQGKDTYGVSTALLSSIKTLVDHTKGDYLGNLLSARGLGQFGLTLEDLRRLKATPRSELDQYLSQSEEDRRKFEVDPKTQKAFQDFDRMLNASKTQIEGAFVRGLAPLTPELTKLSGSFANAVSSFLAAPEVKQGIQDLAKYIGSPQFRTDLKNFATDMGYAAHKIADGLKWLGLIPDHSPEAEKQKTAEDNRRQNLLDGGNRPTSYPDSSLRNNDPNRPSRWWDPGSWQSGQGAVAQHRISLVEWDKGLPKNLLYGVYGAESAFGKNAGYSKAGALGAFQMMEGTAARYGVHDRTDFDQESRGAGSYLADLLRRYKGDIKKALAGYNWGEGNVDKDIKRFGAAWEQHLPKETAGYIKKVLAIMAAGPKASPRPGTPEALNAAAGRTAKVKVDAKVHVTVQSQPGSNPVVSASTVAAGG